MLLLRNKYLMKLIAVLGSRVYVEMNRIENKM